MNNKGRLSFILNWPFILLPFGNLIGECYAVSLLSWVGLFRWGRIVTYDFSVNYT